MDDAALFDAVPEPEVARRLLPYLCTATGASRLTFASAPAQMLGGFDTLVYAFEVADPPPALAGPLVLRVYRDARGPERAHLEACVQNAVGELGYPTPRVLLTCLDRTVLGGAFQVMRRVHGRVMLDAIFGPSVLRMPTVLATLHAQLHSLDAQAFTARLTAAKCSAEQLSVAADLDDLQARIGAAQLSGLAPALEWVQNHLPSARGRNVVCHGDFHPLNVLVDGQRVSGVLDWARTKLADPAWDVGATIALTTHGPLRLPGVLHRAAMTARQWFVDRYVSAYVRLRPLDRTAVRYYEAVRCLAMLVEAGEHIQVQRGVIPPVAKPTAFKDARTLRGLLARVRAISAIDAALPPAAPLRSA